MHRSAPSSRPTRTRLTTIACLLAGLTLGVVAPPVAAESAPNGDLPTVGRSLFDILTTVRTDEGARLRVPYPFKALRALISKAGGLDDGDLSETLFPLGRSLQRHAAAPDFFASPRVVLGVTGEPLAADPPTTMMLKDRLYVGYQPRSESLEVISYNEQAGRFEFQIVESYAEGKTPRTLQARRALCLSCHQNGGPIFPKPPWSETPANPRIAARLAAAADQPRMGNAAVTEAAQAVARLYRSVENANRLVHARKIWTQACGDPWAPRRCEVGLLSTVLEHRLSGRRSHGQGDFPTRREAEDYLADAQYHVWKDGIEIATPFIADRDPLAPGGTPAEDGDPLTPRPALQVLRVSKPGTTDRILDLLADPFSASDITWLESALRGVVEGVGARRQVAELPCDLIWTPATSGDRVLDFDCRNRVPEFPEIDGRLTIRANGDTSAIVDQLKIQLLTYKKLTASGLEILRNAGGGEQVVTHPIDPATGLRPRTGNGWSIASVTLDWSAGSPAAGTATFTMVDDITRFRGTVRSLTSYGLPNSERAVAEGPLRRRDIMRALAIRLGRPIQDWCCGPEPDLPPAATRATAILALTGLSNEPGPAHPSLQAFHRNCGGCHGGAAEMPPNFLFGPSERQLDAIAGCAPRILARLDLWRNTTETPLSPMPPPSRLAAIAGTPDQWLASSDFRGIHRLAEELSIQFEASGSANYATLPVCAPPPIQ